MTKTALITGASGLLGRQVQRAFHLDGWHAVGTGLSRINPPDVVKLDLLDAKEIDQILDHVKPDVVIHCAANRFPDKCDADPEGAKMLNVVSSRVLAEATIRRDVLLIYISTDYVFSGRPGEAPYTTSSPPDPPNMYGQTKLDGETAVLQVADHSSNAKNRVVVLRVPVLYGSCDEPKESAVNVLLSQLWSAQNIQAEDAKIKIDDYALRFPTNTADVARVCRDISTVYLGPSNTARPLPNVLQFTSEDQMTKWDIVKIFSEIMGLPLDGLEPFKPEADPKNAVQRPYDCHLDTSALTELDIDVSTVDFRVWWRREVHAFR
ncbi:hypothetical protein B0J11DRAFT_156221 [Dendryphion nanum]|uniref:RmlD-like substrate binding domain-containing protein n=1 Tax=Dendryphion nanum TaxID=256645 RepID=A0A9P9ITW6_9PLEO|nr:hypothetical protein B0J11DRAFT_156221 [Dendryphion nanum]